MGVDGMTAEEYEQDLEGNLQQLLDRAKSGTYRALPVRRVHIPKGGSSTETRPIGIPTLEDKVLQRSVVMLLEPIYEQDFLDCSYGFRPRRSTHQALQSFRSHLMDSRGGRVLEVDIRKFFENLDHGHLRQFLQLRVRELPRRHACLIRYADDFVIGFRDYRDAQRVMEVLPKRFSKYGLTIHPDKTQLVSFRPTSSATDNRSELRKRPGTFDLLGFTHYWGRSQRGY